MADSDRQIKEPSVQSISFSCPHCGVFTTHTWAEYYGRSRTGNDDERLPNIWTSARVERITEKLKSATKAEQEKFEDILAHASNAARGEPIALPSENTYPRFTLLNFHSSKCFACRRLSLWLGERLLYPSTSSAEQAHQQMPADVRVDFDEARAILNESPRGAAALLRLCIQKLCKVLGELGKNIDQDIAALVRKGLPEQIQQALDSVRVIGNEAVHPGEMDLKDDRDTASELFRLVNYVVEEMIARPARMRGLYARLPQAKRDGIDRRDAKAPGTP